MDENLKDRLKKDFDVDLDISGGNGKSLADPIIINQSIRDCVGAEYYIVQLIFQAMGKEWKTVKQTIVTAADKKIDQLTIEVTDVDGEKHQTDFYFDISKHIKN